MRMWLLVLCLMMEILLCNNSSACPCANWCSWSVISSPVSLLLIDEMMILSIIMTSLYFLKFRIKSLRKQLLLFHSVLDFYTLIMLFSHFRWWWLLITFAFLLLSVYSLLLIGHLSSLIFRWICCHKILRLLFELLKVL